MCVRSSARCRHLPNTPARAPPPLQPRPVVCTRLSRVARQGPTVRRQTPWAWAADSRPNHDGPSRVWPTTGSKRLTDLRDSDHGMQAASSLGDTAPPGSMGVPPEGRPAPYSLPKMCIVGIISVSSPHRHTASYGRVSPVNHVDLLCLIADSRKIRTNIDNNTRG